MGCPQPEPPDLAAAGDAATSSPRRAATALPHFLMRARRNATLNPDTTIPLVSRAQPAAGTNAPRPYGHRKPGHLPPSTGILRWARRVIRGPRPELKSLLRQRTGVRKERAREDSNL